MFLKPKIEVRYVANSGISIRNKDKHILIDGVHVKAEPPYFGVAENDIQKMIAGDAPYDNIDIMFFTHEHPDHFDAQVCNEILKNNKLTQTVGSAGVGNALKSISGYDASIESQIHELGLEGGRSIQMTMHEIPFEAFSLEHDGEEYGKIQNYAYVFEMGGKVFAHIGDAHVTMENFENSSIFRYHPDVLFVPFPFVGLTVGRKIIHKLRPQKLFVTHLPDKKYDTMNWIYNTQRVYKKYEKELPSAEFMLKPGQIFKI